MVVADGAERIAVEAAEAMAETRLPHPRVLSTLSSNHEELRVDAVVQQAPQTAQASMQQSPNWLHRESQ